MHILVIGLNYKTAPVEIRERFAFREEEKEEAIRTLRAAKSIQECVIVGTCNRTEVYAVVDQLHTGRHYVKAFLSEWFGIPKEEFIDYLYIKENDQATRHLFRVICGLDSMVLGETQILGQIRSAFMQSQELKATGPAINFAQLTQTDGSFLVSRKDIKNFNWNMLKGKNLIGQRPGGMPEMVSEYVLKRNGVTPFKDVNIIQNIDYANLGSAFASGTGDFVQLFEPIASQLEIQGKGYVVASCGKDSGKLPYTDYITRQSFIKEHPDIVQKFTDVIYKAQQWVASHSTEEIADAIAPQFNDLDRKTLIKVIDRYKSQGSFAQNPVLDEEEYHNLEAVMENSGQLKQKVDYKDIVNTEFAKNAMK